MFHFHKWVKFVVEIMGGSVIFNSYSLKKEEFRKCTKCGKIENLIGVAGYDAMWREVSPKSFSKESIKKINNEFNKKTGHKLEELKEEIKEAEEVKEKLEELEGLKKKYDNLIKKNKKITKQNKELKENNKVLRNKYTKFDIIDI